MPRIPVPAAGGAPFIPYLKKSIRLLRHGCSNRPFYHIVVMDTTRYPSGPVIEQLGSYDPMPNEQNERLCALNFERIRYWLGEGLQLSPGVSQLLGLSGFLPIHPRSYMLAWRGRGEEPAYKQDPTYENRAKEIIMKARQYREEKAAKAAEEEEAEKAQQAEAQ